MMKKYVTGKRKKQNDNFGKVRSMVWKTLKFSECIKATIITVERVRVSVLCIIVIRRAGVFMGKTLCVPDEVPAPKYYCKECDQGRPTSKNINGTTDGRANRI